MLLTQNQVSRNRHRSVPLCTRKRTPLTSRLPQRKRNLKFFKAVAEPEGNSVMSASNSAPQQEFETKSASSTRITGPLFTHPDCLHSTKGGDNIS
jgi:hypothetical protein